MSWDHADTFREKLRRGKVCLGTVISLTDPTVTEALCPLFDFLWIDMEHSVLSLEAVQAHVMAARGSGAATLVRVPWNDPVLVKPVLDLGASGVIVPMVRTADDVRRAVAACLYPPEGVRGFGPRRPSQYGRLGGPEFCREANARACRSSRSSTSMPSRTSTRSSPCRGWRASPSARTTWRVRWGSLASPAIRTCSAPSTRSSPQPAGKVPVGISVGEDPGDAGGVGLAGRELAGDGRRHEPHAPGGGRGRWPGPRAGRGTSPGESPNEDHQDRDHSAARAPQQSIWVQLHTADGLVGLGETYHVPGAVEAVIHDSVAPLLLGQSAFDRERHWQNFLPSPISSATRGRRCGRCSALDIAIWDLLGQHVGQPIYNLLGGRCRESIPIYNTCVNTPKYPDQDAFLERPGELARSLLDQGIRQMKVWPWDRFAPQLRLADDPGPAGWAAIGPPGPLPVSGGPGGRSQGCQGNPQGGRQQDAYRDRGPLALGPELRTCGSPGPSSPTMSSGWKTSSSRIAWPIWPAWSTRAGAAGGERTAVYPIRLSRSPRAAGRRTSSCSTWSGPAASPRPSRSPPWPTLITWAITPHDCTGPINVFAALHLCAAAQNVTIMETVRGFCEGYYLELLARPLPIREGRAVRELGPGLGVELRPEVLSRPDLRRRVSGVDN